MLSPALSLSAPNKHCFGWVPVTSAAFYSKAETRWWSVLFRRNGGTRGRFASICLGLELFPLSLLPSPKDTLKFRVLSTCHRFLGLVK